MVTPVTINGAFVGAKVLQKLGTINVNLTLCPFQPSNSGFKAGPRFWGIDGLGQYWGPNGYYRSTPCYNNANPPKMVQFSGFSVTPFGCFDFSSLLPNPNTYSANPSSIVPALGQAPNPNTAGVRNNISGGQACQGLQGIYSGSLYSLGSDADRQWSISKLSSPLTLFENITTPPKINALSYLYESIDTRISSFVQFNVPPIFTLLDYKEAEHCITPSIFSLDDYGIDLQSISTVLVNGYYPYQIPNIFTQAVPQVLYSLTTHSAGVYGVKVNPINGNAIVSGDGFGGENGPYALTNVIINWQGYVAYPPPVGFINPNPQYLLSLSDSGDNAIFAGPNNIARPVSQFAGGWFGLYTNVTKTTIFMVDQTVSNYYRVNFTLPAGIGTGATSLNPETLARDFAGNWYYLDYPEAFNAMYSSVGQPRVIDLVVPQLTSWGVTCKQSTMCEPWM